MTIIVFPNFRLDLMRLETREQLIERRERMRKLNSVCAQYADEYFEASDYSRQFFEQLRKDLEKKV